MDAIRMHSGYLLKSKPLYILGEFDYSLRYFLVAARLGIRLNGAAFTRPYM